MGLIKKLPTKPSQDLNIQSQEVITCDELKNDILIKCGTIHHQEPAIVKTGSGLSVPDNTALILIQNGKILDFCAEPGQYTYEVATEPSIYAGHLGQSVIDTIKTTRNSTPLGIQEPNSIQAYYVNLQALAGNKFGSPSPKTITDDKHGELEITYFGEYTVKVANPVILIKTIIAHGLKDTISLTEVLEDQFKTTFVDQIPTAITTVMHQKHISVNDVGIHNHDISNTMNILLDNELYQKYGLTISDVTLANIHLTEESMNKVTKPAIVKTPAEPPIQEVPSPANATPEKPASPTTNSSLMGFMNLSMATPTPNETPKVPAEPTFKEPIVKPETIDSQSIQPAKEQPLNPFNITPNINPSIPSEPQPPIAKPKDEHFCTNCGKPTNGGNFCGYCGAKLK